VTLAISDLPLLIDPVLHVPNITEVCGSHEFFGLAEYMLRSVALLGAKQYLVLPRSFRTAALELLNYHRELGVTEASPSQLLFTSAKADARFTTTLLQDGELMAVLRRLPLARVEPFVANPAVERLASELGLELEMDPRVAAALNHKAHAREVMEVSGLRTPGGQLLRRSDGDFERRVLSELACLFREGHKVCALTRPSSFSGIGIRRLRSLAQARDALAGQLRDAPELLVEPWLDRVTGSPSFVLCLGEHAAQDRVLVTTEQLLQDAGDTHLVGPCHFGNVIPARELPRSLVEGAARALRSVGAVGIVGVDLVQSAGDFLVTEVNARQTGSIFGAVAALKARQDGRVPPCVVHNNIPVPLGCTLHDYVAHLERIGLHLGATSQRGVIVVSQGNMHVGKVMVVAIGEEFTSHVELVERIGLFAS
jgi:ATP-grasp domain